MANIIPWRRSSNTGDLAGVNQFRSDMDRLLDRFFTPLEQGPLTGDVWLPAVDVKDKGNEVTVCAELPGLKPEDIDISVSGNTLQIRGERKEEVEDSGSGYYARERRYGAFSRTIELPTGVDAGRIAADYRDGELIVRIPKSEQDKPRRIAVNTPGRATEPSNTGSKHAGESRGASGGKAQGVGSSSGNAPGSTPGR
ncbi:MAG TPA: Hsp20/alpha crystallin family protein [Phycisphaerales bacterium]|nr:Hsp20/alpha crystallin family protein [Phycisphaerales bacterium]